MLYQFIKKMIKRIKTIIDPSAFLSNISKNYERCIQTELNANLLIFYQKSNMVFDRDLVLNIVFW